MRTRLVSARKIQRRPAGKSSPPRYYPAGSRGAIRIVRNYALVQAREREQEARANGS